MGAELDATVGVSGVVEQTPTFQRAGQLAEGGAASRPSLALKVEIAPRRGPDLALGHDHEGRSGERGDTRRTPTRHDAAAETAPWPAFQPSLHKI